MVFVEKLKRLVLSELAEPEPSGRIEQLCKIIIEIDPTCVWAHDLVSTPPGLFKEAIRSVRFKLLDRGASLYSPEGETQ